jgi:hypothetical protein
VSIDLNSVRQIAKYVPGQRVRDIIMDLVAEVETLRAQRALENEDLVNAYDKGKAAGIAEERASVLGFIDHALEYPFPSAPKARPQAYIRILRGLIEAGDHVITTKGDA